MYSDYGYKKPTRFWTNIKGFNPKKCKMNCDNLIAVEKGGKVTAFTQRTPRVVRRC